jgi:hypothetical protein
MLNKSICSTIILSDTWWRVCIEYCVMNWSTLLSTFVTAGDMNLQVSNELMIRTYMYHLHLVGQNHCLDRNFGLQGQGLGFQGHRHYLNKIFSQTNTKVYTLHCCIFLPTFFYNIICRYWIVYIFIISVPPEFCTKN